jgi:hypothetical protein
LRFKEEGKGIGAESQEGRFSSTETNGQSVIHRKERAENDERGGRAKQNKLTHPIEVALTTAFSTTVNKVT